MSCIVDGDWGGTRPAPNWHFDSIWGVGMLGSHEILEVQPDGSISIAPAETMAKLFDEVTADNLQRKSVLLSCGIWGSFGSSDFPALHTPLMIRIKEGRCDIFLLRVSRLQNSTLDLYQKPLWRIGRIFFPKKLEGIGLRKRPSNSTVVTPVLRRL